MGRTEPTTVKQPAAFRRDGRAKRARATVNKVIPALLLAHPRAQRGIERSELIVDPPRFISGGQVNNLGDVKKAPNATRNGHRKKTSASSEEPQPKSRNHDAEKVSRRDESIANGSQKSACGVHSPRITLAVTDTLTAAHSLLEFSPKYNNRHHKKYDTNHASDTKTKVGILNMASPLEPGGGFLKGATSQEESLCMRTTLLPGLRDEFYRLPELGVVYTPDVLVFRCSADAEDEKDVLPKNDRWFVDVVSAAMLRLPETEDGRYARAVDRELVVRKMRAVLRVFAARGCMRVVLGAWGCGAYGNPVVEIAETWRRVLLPLSGCMGDASQCVSGEINSNDATAKEKKKPRRDAETWGAVIEHVVFAIKDVGLANAFVQAFGDDLLPLPAIGVGELGSFSSSSSVAGEADPVEVARVSELQSKIKELELQGRQAKSPHLRAGLDTVLAGLRMQLPVREGDGGPLDSDQEEESGGDDDDDDDDEKQESGESHSVSTSLAPRPTVSLRVGS
ncbi:hypothetical protein GGS21DRAFT_504153 [Xylaria nigripes]|nr:hypothetical protein GGS21DRAFT_504153 [Xylaria nigripes]